MALDVYIALRNFNIALSWSPDGVRSDGRQQHRESVPYVQSIAQFTCIISTYHTQMAWCMGVVGSNKSIFKARLVIFSVEGHFLRFSRLSASVVADLPFFGPLLSPPFITFLVMFAFYSCSLEAS